MRVPCVVAMRARRENGCGRRVHAGDAAVRSSARTVVAHVLSPAGQAVLGRYGFQKP